MRNQRITSLAHNFLGMQQHLTDSEKKQIKNRSTMNSKNLIGGLLAGAALGVAIGMLLAPSSGANTRKKIVKGSEDLVDELKSQVEEGFASLKSQVTILAEETLKKGKDAVLHGADRAKELINHGVDRIKA